MGNKATTFTEEQLEAYQDCTFFTRKEILSLPVTRIFDPSSDTKREIITEVFQRFQMLDPDQIPFDMTGSETRTLKIPVDTIENMSELKENPFKRRICEVFSEDGSGSMSFDDFLDMFSIFSEAAPRDIKTVYAFRIYDFDGDNYLNREDLEKTLFCLSGKELSTEEVTFVVDKVLEETDLDDDGSLSYIEFEHVISRAPDFLNTFHIRL